MLCVGVGLLAAPPPPPAEAWPVTPGTYVGKFEGDDQGWIKFEVVEEGYRVKFQGSARIKCTKKKRKRRKVTGIYYWGFNTFSFPISSDDTIYQVYQFYYYYGTLRGTFEGNTITGTVSTRFQYHEGETCTYSHPNYKATLTE
jgi:hypothetical protein